MVSTIIAPGFFIHLRLIFIKKFENFLDLFCAIILRSCICQVKLSFIGWLYRKNFDGGNSLGWPTCDLVIFSVGQINFVRSRIHW